MNSKLQKYVGDTIVFLIGLVLPFHSVISFPLGRANLSLADPFILLALLLLMVGTSSLLALPRFGFVAVSFILIAGFSVAILPLTGESYLNLNAGLTGILKIAYAVAYFIILCELFSRRRWQRLYFFSLGTIVILTFLALWTSVETLQGVHRPSGSFGNPNLYADYLVFSLFLISFFVYTYYRSRARLVSFALCPTFILVIISLLGTQSRGAIGGLILGVGFLTILKAADAFRFLRQRPTKTVLGGLGSTVIAYFLFRTRDWGIVQRFREALRGEQSEWNRINIWQAHMDAFIENPLTGIGYGQYDAYLTVTSAHNTIVKVLSQTGLVGGFLFLLLAILALRFALHLILVKGQDELAFILAFLIATGGNSMFHDVIHFRTFWIALAVLGAYSTVYPPHTDDNLPNFSVSVSD